MLGEALCVRRNPNTRLSTPCPLCVEYVIASCEAEVIDSLTYSAGDSLPIPTKLDERPLDADAPSAAYSTAWLPPGVMRPFVLITGLFFLWGIPNNLNDVLIRQFMKSFEISRFQAGLVQSAFYLGYFLLALPAGRSEEDTAELPSPKDLRCPRS